MAILFAVVARGSTVLAKHACFSGNFLEVTEQILAKIPSENNKLTYSHGRYNWHCAFQLWMFSDVCLFWCNDALLVFQLSVPLHLPWEDRLSVYHWWCEYLPREHVSFSMAPLTYWAVRLSCRSLSAPVHLASWMRWKRDFRPLMAHEHRPRCPTPWTVSFPARWLHKWYVHLPFLNTYL